MKRHRDSASEADDGGGRRLSGSSHVQASSEPERTGTRFPTSPSYGSPRQQRRHPHPHPLSARGVLPVETRRQNMSHAIVNSAYGFPYSRKLEVHTGCVNALAFSSKDGRFLASGGDDTSIRLWDFYQDDVKTISYTMRGPSSNIFSLNFSATNKFLYAGGLCKTIYQYDVAYLGTPAGASTKTDRSFDHAYHDNEDSIRSLTCHPRQDDLLMSASEDGTIRRYDWRQGGAPPSSQDIIQTENEVTDVKFHPTMEHLFADSDGSGRVFLRDSRMAFGSLPKRSNEGIVRRYNTKLTKKTYSHLSHPEASSITFDKDGLKLAVTFLHYLPTIFSVSDPNPLAVLSGKNLPDGTPVPSNQTTYSNSCTMKHGSFGGPGLDNDDMYAAGSDDFYCYIWRIPPLPQLMDQREIYTEKRWSVYGDASTIAFTEGRHEPKIAPVELSTPLDRLTGHNSIVNTTLFHPHFLHIVTAGVENGILLHSPTPSSPCTQNLQRSPENVRVLKDEDAEEDRRLYYRALLGAHSPDAEDNEGIERNERRTLRMFDHIIREEGQVDCFETRPWRSDGEDSSDEDNDEEDEDDDSDTLLLDISGEEVFPRIRMFLN